MQDSGPKARTGRKRGRGNTAEQKVLRDMYAEARNSEMRNSLLLEQECLLNMQRVQSQKISEMTDEIQSLDPATQIFATKLVSASNADRNSMTNPEDVREREFNNTIKHYKEVLRRPLERFEAEERKKRGRDGVEERSEGSADVAFISRAVLHCCHTTSNPIFSFSCTARLRHALSIVYNARATVHIDYLGVKQLQVSLVLCSSLALCLQATKRARAR